MRGVTNPRRAWAALPFTLLLLGCPRPSPRAQPTAAERADAVERTAARLLHAQDEALWKSWLDGSMPDLQGPQVLRDALLAPESLTHVEQALEGAVGDERRALLRLKTFLVGERLARAIADPADAVARLESSMTFLANGRELPFRDLSRLLAEESSAAKRKALWLGATQALERLNPMIARRDERLETALQEMGYCSLLDYALALREVTHEELSALAEGTLAATDEPFLALLASLAPAQAQLPASRLRRWDLPRLFRTRSIDDKFPKDALLERARATLAGLGLEPATVKGLTLDARDLPKKNPRPLTLSVSAPGDVRVSVRLLGGAQDQATLFHELGHALFAAHSAEPRFSLAKLGGHAVAEGYAQLFERLVENPLWLEEHASLTGEAAARHMAMAQARRLYELRRAAGLTLYALARHTSNEDEAELYRAHSAWLYGVPCTEPDAARFRLESDPFLHHADELQADLLADALERALTERFGARWWKSAEAGQALKALWASGRARTPREVTARIAALPGPR